MKILLTGKTGQVGSALLSTLPPFGEVIAPERSQLDLANCDSVRAAVRRVKPRVIVNAAAYTAVDRAEREESLAFAINGDAPAVLAEESAKAGVLLVHYSTDYVFDGEKLDPYVETDLPNPLNAYGRSKLAGEQAIQASGCRHLIFRTAWVYAASGNNFMLTMLRLARERKPLRVVDDQYGAPTSSLMIARATAEALGKLGDESGVYHMTAAGRTTWYAFAQAIFQATGIAASVEAIPSSAYKTPARRPRNSLLDNQLLRRHEIRLPSWEEGLHEVTLASA